MEKYGKINEREKRKKSEKKNFFFPYLSGFAATAQKVERTGSRKVKVQGVDHGHFRLEDLLFRTGIVGNVDVVVQFGRVDFLEFAGDEHGRHSHQLQLVLGHVNRWNLQK